MFKMEARVGMIISVVADFDEKIAEMSDYTIRVPIRNDKNMALQCLLYPFIAIANNGLFCRGLQRIKS